MPLDSVDIARALALIEDGRSIRYAANAIGAPVTTVHRAVRRFHETGQYTRRPGSGRKKATTHRDDRFLVSNILRDRQMTAVMIRNRLQEVRQVNVSERTVRRRLAEGNLGSYKPAKGPKLTQNHRRLRLEFARQHQDWTVNHWRRVLFSDESRFCVRSPDGREKVWRRPGERFASCTFSTREPFHGGSIMIWGGISFEAHTDLVLVENGSLNAHRYIHEILEPHVVPYGPFIGEDFVFMHDNARPHIAHCVSLYLDTVGIYRMDWPACSPDLNPIEHVWDKLGRQIRSHPVVPDNLNDLRIALLEEWERIPQDYVQNLFESMPRRMEAVIRARGGNTRY
jgi:transposase